jgi:hypothetical protein
MPQHGGEKLPKKLRMNLNLWSTLDDLNKNYLK